MKYVLYVLLVLCCLNENVNSQPSVISGELREKLTSMHQSQQISISLRFNYHFNANDYSHLLSPDMTDSERGFILVTQFQYFALSKQKNALSILSKASEEGQASKLRNIWAAGIIYCHASKNTIQHLAQDKNIRFIREEGIKKIEMLETYKPGGSSLMPGSSPDIAPTLELIGAPKLWELGITGEDIRVAVIDEGFDASVPFHADLINNLWNGKSEVSDDMLEWGIPPQALIHHGWDLVGTPPLF